MCICYIKALFRFIFYKYRYKRKCIVAYSCKIGSNSEFEGYNKIGAYSEFDGYMGMYSYIAVHCDFYGKIGRFSSIGRYTSVVRGTHPITAPFVSTHPIFYSKRKQVGISFVGKDSFEELKYADDKKKYYVVVGNDCWIGAYVKIIQGTTIGNGAVVLPGAIVTKDVPPYAIVGGIPAKIIRYRYDNETIDFLNATQWWNNTPNWFMEKCNIMNDIEAFRQYYKDKN